MNPISLTHANLGREIIVAREMVFAIYHSEAHKATHVLSSGGAIIPVSETVNQVRELVYGKPQPKASPAPDSLL
jgi:hypothetical protein